VLQTETEKEFLGKIKSGYRSPGLKNQRDRIPDGLVLLNTPVGYKWVALEVELTRKSGNRYRKIFSNHLTTQAWQATIYFVRSESLKRVLAENCQYSKANDPSVKFRDTINDVYFVDLERFLKEKSQALFVIDNDQFSLESLSKKVHKNGNKTPA